MMDSALVPSGRSLRIYRGDIGRLMLLDCYVFGTHRELEWAHAVWSRARLPVVSLDQPIFINTLSL